MPRPGTGATSREDLRRKNLAAIFDAIHRVGPVSRTDLANTLGLSPATVSSITADLIRTGMVYEAEQGVSSRAGRKPILLDIDYDHDFVVGAKLSATTLTVAITNLRAEVRVARDAALADHAPEDVADVIARTVHAAARAAGLEEAALAGMCLSVPGIVDAATGRVRHSPLPAWCQAPLADLVHDRLAIPVMIENDVNALAVAEAWFGAGSDHADFLVVTLGRGVGLGIVLDGHVYRGPAGGAGEFGHTVLSLAEDGTVTTVEDLLSDEALLRRARGLLRETDAPAHMPALLALAHAGEGPARQILARAGTELGVALSTLVNIFAPTLLVLGGESVGAAPFLLPSARAALQRYAFGDLATTLEIVVEPWGDDAWARGAAGLAASRYLSETGARGVIRKHHP